MKMKKTLLPLSVFMIFSGSCFAQGIDWGRFDSKVETPSSGSESSTGGSTTVISSSDNRTNVSNTQIKTCDIRTKKDQKTLPLYILQKLTSSGHFFNVTLDEQEDRVMIKSEPMIAHCNEMLELNVKANSDKKPVSYEVSVNLRNFHNKDTDKAYQGNVEDFEKCISDSVFTDGAVDATKVNSGLGTLTTQFPLSAGTGEIKFSSSGPLALALGNPFGGKIDYTGCLAVEQIGKDKILAKSIADRRKEKRELDVSGLCQAKDYRKLNESILRQYEEYSKTLTKLRDSLLLEEVKKLSKAIQAGTNLEGLDYSVISDFKKYIVDELAKEIEVTYNELKTAQGDSRIKLEKKLKELKEKLLTYKKSPYLTDSDLVKLKNAGQFDAAEELANTRIILDEYRKVGNIEGGLMVSANAAKQRSESKINQLHISMEEERIKYKVKHGEITGQSQYYANLSNQLSSNINTRTKNYQATMYKLMRLAQKKCSYPWVNKAKCLNKYANKIQNLQVMLSNANDRDTKLAEKYRLKAVEYAQLEAEGTAYVKKTEGSDTVTESEDVVITDDLSVDEMFDFSDDGSSSQNYSQNQQYQNPQGYSNQVYQPFYDQQNQQYQQNYYNNGGGRGPSNSGFNWNLNGYSNNQNPYQTYYQQQPSFNQQPYMNNNYGYPYNNSFNQPTYNNGAGNYNFNNFYSN